MTIDEARAILRNPAIKSRATTRELELAMEIVVGPYVSAPPSVEAEALSTIPPARVSEGTLPSKPRRYLEGAENPSLR